MLLRVKSPLSIRYAAYMPVNFVSDSSFVSFVQKQTGTGNDDQKHFQKQSHPRYGDTVVRSRDKPGGQEPNNTAGRQYRGNNSRCDANKENNKGAPPIT